MTAAGTPLAAPLEVAPPASAAMRPVLDVVSVRRDFPALDQRVNDRPLVYFDNAASAQKPRAVIDAVAHAYAYGYSNVHRGVHTLSQRATAAYEGARDTARRFLGAAETAEIVFVRGATEGINLVAQSFVRPRLAAGDEVLISAMEHHSNIVPWQMVCEATSAHLRVIPVDDQGELLLDAYAALLTPRTQIVAVAHVSNALGTINPVAEMVALARRRGIPTLIDGAQAAPHLALDVQALGCDFYAVSGHKLFGPTGIGVLYGRGERLRETAPYQGGGEMIRSVTFAQTEYAEPPHKLEAGTPHIVGAIGLAAAMDYLEQLDLDAIAAYEHELLAYATARLMAQPAVRLIGTARQKAAVLSFVIDGVHAHDVGTILDQEGIAVRAGHHCAQPLMERYGLAATVRASLAFYNTHQEVDRLVTGIERVLEIFGR